MTGIQMEALRDALCSAFDQDALDQMLRFRLDKDRVHLAGSGTLATVVFKVIEVAAREGWEAELVRAAISYNPGNVALRRFCDENPDMTGEGRELVTAPPLDPGASRRVAKTRIQTVLWVNDKPDEGEQDIAGLRARGLTVVRAGSTSEAMRLLITGQVKADAIVSDMGRREEGEYRTHAGILLVELVRKARFRMPVVIYASPKYKGKNHAMVVEAGGTAAVASEAELLQLLGIG